MSKIEYSCKRKKDFVTFIAIAMFVAICLFEVYLIIFLKLQQQRKNAMAHDIIKQEMLTRTVNLRAATRHTKPGNPLQECEVMLVTDGLDHVVRFIRRNVDTMTDPQIVAANDILFQLEAHTLPWQKKNFLFKQDEFEIQPVLNEIEKKLDQASAEGR